MNASIAWRDHEGALTAFLQEGGKDTNTTIEWAPQVGSQEAFLACPVYECLYEGTRGPGKTDALIMDFCQHVDQGFGIEWRGILFRQSFPQLTDVINKSKKWIPRIWPDAKFNESKSTWHFKAGESLKFAFIQKSDDYWNYHGHAYPWIGFEELTTWFDPSCYTVMMACSRSTMPGMPRKYRSTTNSYGKGHTWVKHRWQLPIMKGNIVGPIIREPDKPARVAIHGDLRENKILLHADPDYIQRIKEAARNPSELAAWVEGSWDITAGGMFDDIWDSEIHVVPQFDVPHSWRIDRSFDWGSSAPFSVGWWAQSDGSDLVFPNGDCVSTVRGDLFRVHEWYGWDGNISSPGGIKMMATEVAKGVVEREIKWWDEHRVKPGPADSSIYNVENGMSIGTDMAQRIRIDGRIYKGVRWVSADKKAGSRKTGWEMMRNMMQHSKRKDGLPREFPGLFVTENCRQFIRTVPILPRDERDLDDVDTDTEDHIADEARYRIRNVGKIARTRQTVGMT